MTAGVAFYRKEMEETIVASRVSGVFPRRSNEGKRWMFLAAHDDDVVAGAGLTAQAAAAEGGDALASFAASPKDSVVQSAESGARCVDEVRGDLAREDALVFARLGDRVAQGIHEHAVSRERLAFARPRAVAAE